MKFYKLKKSAESNLISFSSINLGLFCFFYCLSCVSESDINEKFNKYAPGKSRVAFEQGIILKTDTLFNFDAISNFFHYDQDGTEEIVVLNGNAIYEFDPLTGEMIDSWEFPVEGPGRVRGRNQLDGVIKLKDTIYLLTHHMLNQIYRISSKNAEVQFKMNADQRGVKAFSASALSSPIRNPRKEEEVIIPLINSSRIEKHSKAFAFAKFNYKEKSLEEIINYPAIFDDHHWADQIYIYLANIQYIPKKEQYYVSFAITPEVYIFDEEFGQVGKKWVQSNLIPEIHPFRDEKLGMDDVIDFQVERRHFRSMSFYLGAYYDPLQQLYFRFARKAMKDETGENGYRYQYSMIVCNSDLKIIDEIALDNHYNLFKTFVSSKGLMILNEKKLTEESSLPFDRVVVRNISD